MFQRLGCCGAFGANVHVVPEQVTSQALAALSSGSEPSIIRSIEPELSTSSRTFGFGGLRSSCCARAGTAANAPAASNEDAAIRPTNRILIVTSSSILLLLLTRHRADVQTCALDFRALGAPGIGPARKEWHGQAVRSRLEGGPGLAGVTGRL